MSHMRFEAEILRDEAAVPHPNLGRRVYGGVRVVADWPVDLATPEIRVGVEVSGDFDRRDAAAYVELFFHDVFLILNLSTPGSFGGIVSMAGGELRVRDVTFSARVFGYVAAGLGRVAVGDVVAWYDALGIGTQQIATTAETTALFQPPHLSRGGGARAARRPAALRAARGDRAGADARPSSHARRRSRSARRGPDRRVDRRRRPRRRQRHRLPAVVSGRASRRVAPRGAPPRSPESARSSRGSGGCNRCAPRAPASPSDSRPARCRARSRPPRESAASPRRDSRRAAPRCAPAPPPSASRTTPPARGRASGSPRRELAARARCRPPRTPSRRADARARSPSRRGGARRSSGGAVPAPGDAAGWGGCACTIPFTAGRRA